MEGKENSTSTVVSSVHITCHIADIVMGVWWESVKMLYFTHELLAATDMTNKQQAIDQL